MLRPTGWAIRVLVVHTQGDWQIALECFWLGMLA
jgi:hypothetical protein